MTSKSIAQLRLRRQSMRGSYEVLSEECDRMQRELDEMRRHLSWYQLQLLRIDAQIDRATTTSSR